MNLSRWPIPHHWQWCTAAEVSKIVGGGTPSTKVAGNFSESGIPWIGPADLTGYNGVYIGRGRRGLSDKGYASCGATLLPEGAVLFSSRAPIGYCAIASNRLCTNQGFKSWICEIGVVPEYVRYYLLFSVGYVDSLASGTTFREISGKRVEALAFPLPPTAEQRRIVAKLDALTARLTRARSELDRVRLLGDRLRAAALSSIFSKEKLEKWAISRFDDVIDEGLIGLVRSKLEQSLEGVPYIRMNHFNMRGLWNEDALTSVQVSLDELTRFELKAGDVLFNTRNSVELVGKVAMWPIGKPGFVYNNNLLRLRFKSQIIPDFAFWYMMSPYFRTLMETEKSATTSVAAIYQRSLNRAPIPVPSLSEQSSISLYLHSAFNRAERLEAEAARSKKLLDRLESAILSKAFKGELGPQDPTDEPAPQLLDRIRAQRAAIPAGKSVRRVEAAKPHLFRGQPRESVSAPKVAKP